MALEHNPNALTDKGHFTIDGPVGSLEVMSQLPKTPPKGLAVICHPNPLQEGAMTNKVVHTLCQAMIRKGLAALRFNFRGVGHSEGQYDNTVGETLDLLAVAKWGQLRLPNLPLTLGGFSFGGFIATHGATRLNVQQLITVAPAVTLREISQPTCPWLTVMGTSDELISIEEARKWAKVQQQDLVDFTYVEMDEASHFFHGRLIELRAIVEQHLIC